MQNTTRSDQEDNVILLLPIQHCNQAVGLAWLRFRYERREGRSGVSQCDLRVIGQVDGDRGPTGEGEGD